MTRCIYIFPGQGAQYPGMGSDLCQEFETAARIYEQASDVLGYDMRRLCFTDPDQQLNLTRYTQPALLTHHYACLSVYRELSGLSSPPGATAGHSLGEYSALVAAGALNFEQALALVKVRGELMGTHGEGEMLATQLDRATAQPLADKHYCAIGALNLPRQTVVGGAANDLAALSAEIEQQYPRSRSVRLKTEGAFHTYFMVKAAKFFRPVLAEAEIQPPQTKVLSNYTGQYHDEDPAGIRSRLFFSTVSPRELDWLPADGARRRGRYIHRVRRRHRQRRHTGREAAESGECHQACGAVRGTRNPLSSRHQCRQHQGNRCRR